VSMYMPAVFLWAGYAGHELNWFYVPEVMLSGRPSVQLKKCPHRGIYVQFHA